MIYSQEVEEMCTVAQGVHHGAAPIPEEAKWVKSKEIKDISGLTHGVGWCAPQQGACKLTLNVKEGIIQEALVETIGCSGMTHSAAMAAEILPGRTVLEALNTDLVCDAIAAEWVIPEHPMVSTSASWIMPSLTFSVSLQAPCCGAHQPTPWVRPEMSLISFDFTHLASSGIGAAP